MPAIKAEIEGALEEGVKIEFLAAPVEILQKDGRATGIRSIRMELGEPDSSGRPRPVPKPGTEFEIEASAIIAAVSQQPNADGFGDLNPKKGWLEADDWGSTGQPGVFAGGDDIGLGLVGIAIAQGRFAAEAIDACLRGKKLEKPIPPPLIKGEKINLGWYPAAARHERCHVPVEDRGLETEVQFGLSEADALAEAKRCLSCGMCMDCETCWMYCANSCFVRLPKGQHYKLKPELCNGCKKCAEACPCGYIELY
jgi:NADPH-dependent glutamate synthase beta subunit-like oxidoreductase